MEESEHHLTCSLRPHALHLSRSALSARLITPADPHTLSIATATPLSRSLLPEVQRCTKVTDSVPCLSLVLNSAIYPPPPPRVMLGFAFTRHPTACTVTHSLPHRALLPALIKWPPLPLPIIKVPSLARLPVGLSRTVWVCSVEDSRASCLTLGLWDWQVASRGAGPHRSPPTWAEFDSVCLGLSRKQNDTLEWVQKVAFGSEHSMN